MLIIGVLIGIYSYVTLILGLIGKLNNFDILSVSFFYFLLCLIVLQKKIKKLSFFRFNYTDKVSLFIFLLLISLISVNLIGALGPELSFDALWYHLTIPKLFLLHQKVYFIKGNLLYYSLMPKLTEMLYVPSLAFGSEIWAKIIHFGFGLLSCFALYQLARLYFEKKFALLTVIVFYSNLVVAWLSITAYSDLSRAFYEILAFYFFIRYTKSKNKNYIVFSALMLGFAISTKIISLGTLFVFDMIFLLIPSTLLEKIKSIFLFSIISVIIPLPWFIISFINTGNPFFPLFTSLGLRNFTPELLRPDIFLKTFINTFILASDPVSPVYIIFLPIIILLMKRNFKLYFYALMYMIFSYFVWYFTSQAGGTRFLTSYLPVYSILIVASIFALREKILIRASVMLIFAIAVVSIFYRGIANKKYIPVILGFESKQDFLMKNLNFEFGDFYDENHDIKRIVGNSVVQIEGIHNLYYVDFPYSLTEFKENLHPSYILFQGESVPMPFNKNKPLYHNPTTHVKLYKL